jgi:hypothetical protein
VAKGDVERQDKSEGCPLLLSCRSLAQLKRSTLAARF